MLYEQLVQSHQHRGKCGGEIARGVVTEAHSGGCGRIFTACCPNRSFETPCPVGSGITRGGCGGWGHISFVTSITFCPLRSRTVLPPANTRGTVIPRNFKIHPVPVLFFSTSCRGAAQNAPELQRKWSFLWVNPSLWVRSYCGAIYHAPPFTCQEQFRALSRWRGGRILLMMRNP